MTTRGRFIAVEGGEGAGKSTQIDAMMTFLRAHGIDVVGTREPGGTALGEQVRSLLLDPKNTDTCDDAELLLVFAARAQHIKRVIGPALNGGTWVVCDRFTDATYAYQGGGRGIDTARIEALEQWVQGDMRPDFTVVLDIDPKLGLERAAKRGAKDRFEREETQFFERVRHTYLRRAEATPKRYCVLDASASAEAVRKQIETVLQALL